MNLLLVEAGEVDGGRIRLDDRRAVHLRAVLRVEPGATVRAGVIGGGLAPARVIADDGRTIDLELGAPTPAPPPMPIELVLAVPRPKVLSRAVETAAAFGVRRIDLVNAWRVDKAYLDSPRLAPADLAHHLRLGAEQGVTTHLPAVELHRRLMPFLDARFPVRAPGPAPAPPPPRLLAHARAAVPIERAWRELAPAGPPDDGVVVVALGPEGDWIEREVETFAGRGFAAITLGAPVLRVEVALAAALGQLALLLRARDERAGAERR
ncbi:MAG: RsmE family RNA methyltransferase [Kofleriaceae bacterium]|nr:RsmE family RNA methyltransferase [Kofleriaceae bacterium]